MSRHFYADTDVLNMNALNGDVGEKREDEGLTQYLQSLEGNVIVPLAELEDCKVREGKKPKNTKDILTVDSSSPFSELEVATIRPPNHYENRGGEERVFYGGKGAIPVITPVFRQNPHTVTHFCNGQASVWIHCKIFHTRTSLFPLRGYTKHLVDKEFVVEQHKYLNGMLQRWRDSAIDLLKEAEECNLYEMEHLGNQIAFAKQTVPKAMAGIHELTDFPVHILCKSSLMAVVKGCDSEDMADLILKMCCVRTFEIIAHPSSKYKYHFNLITRFGNDKNNQRMYGKLPFKFPTKKKRSIEE